MASMTFPPVSVAARSTTVPLVKRVPVSFWAARTHEAARPKGRLQTIDALAWHGESLGMVRFYWRFFYGKIDTIEDYV